MKEIVKFYHSKNFLPFWLFLAVPLLTLLALKHSLQLALWCDDWLQLWNVKYALLEGPLNPYSLSSYLGPYAPQLAFLGSISHFFGYQPMPYYLVSLILRIGAAIGIYFLSVDLAQNKIAGLVASAFFAVSAISLDTTSWVFNMNSYAGIIFLSTAFVFLLRSRKEGWLKFFLGWSFFLIAVALVPVRMHGAFIIVFLADLLWLLRSFKFPLIFKFFIRQTFFVLGGLWLNSLGSFGTLGRTYEGYLKARVEFLANAILRGERPEMAFSPFITIGNMLAPLLGRQEFGFVKFFKIHPGANPAMPLLISFFLFFIFFAVFLSFYLAKKKRFFLSWCLSAGFIWTLLNYFYLVLNLAGLPSPEVLISSLIGGYFAALMLGLGFSLYQQKQRLAEALLLSLFWIFAFLLLPFFWEPAPLRAEFRYLITPGVGVALSFGCLAGVIGELVQPKLKAFIKRKTTPRLTNYAFLLLPIAVFLLLFLRNISLSNHYLKTLVKTQGAKVYQEAWDSLLKQIPDFDKDKLSIFYLTSSSRYGTGADLHAVFGCGLGFRMGLIYDIDKTDELPIAVVEFDKLASFVTDLDFLKEYRPQVEELIPLERVYAFELVGNRAVDTREETIGALNQIMKAKAK